MPDERTHHTSKKRRYDIVLIPSGDTGVTRRIRFALWQIVTIAVGAVVLVVVSVLLMLIYTPLGPLVPISNPELENKYGRELLAINERMTNLMEQLVEMRTYNVRLRKALGENVELTDSGLVSRGSVRSEPGQTVRRDERQQWTAPPPQAVERSVAVRPEREHRKIADVSRVVFPALMPTEGFITRGYDPGQRHFGLDIAGKTGTIVAAAAEGHVIFAGWTNEDGNTIIISHPGGFQTFYKHNQSLLKSANSFVKRGEPVALLGNSGTTSSAPHLHFEIWKDGAPVDPSDYIINLSF
jgi:murein DD-endopeptidase MepM/ murein hydrolase activator NlpD